MNIIQLTLMAGGILALLAIGYVLFSGPDAGKASQRRLQQVRYRHSDSTDTKVESQLKKAIAARRPTASTKPTCASTERASTTCPRVAWKA